MTVTDTTGLSTEDIDALVQARHDDPFAVLGMHADAQGHLVVRCLLPHAQRVAVLAPASDKTGAGKSRVLRWLERIHPDGLFAGSIPVRRQRFAYRLRVQAADGSSTDVEDPYRFGSAMGEIDQWLLSEGRHLRPYEQMGAHPKRFEGIDGVHFVVWAPNALRCSVVGDFNGWDGRIHPMRRLRGSGLWELFIPAVAEGMRYKYELLDAQGRLLPLHADPFAFRSQLRPDTASVVAHLPPTLPAGDARRRQANGRDAPIAIYEVHAPSWRRVPEEGDRLLDWDELAEQLIPYVRDMGFTHIELMPISEFPFDGSWGYQPIGLYSPTARHGDPAGLARFIARCHEADIGVLLDWVVAHFPKDAHGLARFDGTALYEYADPREGEHRDWNTLIFNYSRFEVVNYLIGNALYWIERFGFDGLRVDAVASMLYRDYSREPGQWIPNRNGGRENLEAIDFLRRVNHVIGVERPEAITIAEESTAWPMVTRPPEDGGLGFHYKWNMGWMNDTLRYMQRDPIHRSHHQNDLSFGLVYAFDENFVLPLSHDEVVHGKGSLLSRMPGDPWQRFANLRAYLGFMYAHPGKKLLFMGDEFAQPHEWSHERSLDWHLLAQPEHRNIQSLVRDLNRLYRDEPALHRLDCDSAGFEWIDYQDSAHSVIAFIRRDQANDSSSLIVAVCNFTPAVHHDYRIGVPRPGLYRDLLNTDSSFYGGTNVGNPFGEVRSDSVSAHGRPDSIVLTLPPLATLILRWQP